MTALRVRAAFAALLGAALAAQAGAAGPPPSGPAAVPRGPRHELDRAEALLRDRLSALPDGSGVVVRRDDDRVTLRIPARLLFDPDRAYLKKDALLSVPMSAALRLLKKRHRLQARIEVYTDSLGGTIPNLSFSEQRAQAVYAALGAAGIVTSRLQEHGAGASAPLASNESPQGRIENRRVEIVFQPAGAGAWADAAAGAASRLRPTPAATP